MSSRRQRRGRTSSGYPSTICIQELSVYGQPNVRADADGYAVEALGDDQGGSNIISAGLVALLSGHEIRAVRAAARTGECYIKLDWTFPGSPYPKFTTRHLLHPSDSTGAVSFSGGLDWAYRMLDSAQSLHIPANQPSQEHASSPMSNPSFTSRHKLPSWMNLIQRHGTPRPPAANREVLASTWTGGSRPEGSHREGRGAGTPEDGSLDGQSRNLQEQVADSEAMYARNGDPSGFLAVAYAAADPQGAWNNGGRPG